MQRKRGELVPIGEVVSGLDDALVPAIRDVSPQARHHFTQADQVNLLVSASEADPDLGFMARTMALCCLPRTNPGDRLQYKRVNGPYKLIMSVTGDHKLPFGNLPRLLLAWVCTEAVNPCGNLLSRSVELQPLSVPAGGLEALDPPQIPVHFGLSRFSRTCV